MSAFNPATGGKPHPGQLQMPPMIGGVLLGTVDTLYFWFSGGRPMSADIEALRRIAARLRSAAARGQRAALPHSPASPPPCAPENTKAV